MTQKFTQSSLIQFIYNEVSATERLAISEALRSDVRLRKQYNALKSAYHKLPKAKFNAPRSAMDNILRYSKTTALESC